VANNKLDLSGRSDEIISADEDVPAGGDHRSVSKVGAAL